MKAIRTTYKGPTDTRGSRFYARDEDGNSTSIPYDYALDPEGNHREAARALCEKMNWDGDLEGGSFGPSMFWVFRGSGAVLSVCKIRKASNA